MSDSEYRAGTQKDEHIDEHGARVPTPDPKDRTGDPDDEPNAAMRELRERKERRDRAEGT